LTVAVCAALYYLIRKGLKSRDLNGGEPVKSRLSSTKLLIILMLSAFAVRALIQQIIGGYEETTGPLFFSGLINSLSSSFSNWASIFNTSAGRAQTHGMLYLYSVIGGLCRLFGIESGDAGIDLMVKIPGIIADILAVGFLFIFIRRYIGDKSAFWCALAYALLPSVFMASAGWGAADSVMGLFLLLAFLSILNKKYVLTCVYTSLAVFFNIKALYVLPLITAFLVYIFVRRVELRSKLAVTAGACILELICGKHQGRRIARLLEDQDRPQAIVESFPKGANGWRGSKCR
jgi:Gpi18-like mannosyltransferase